MCLVKGGRNLWGKNKSNKLLTTVFEVNFKCVAVMEGAKRKQLDCREELLESQNTNKSKCQHLEDSMGYRYAEISHSSVASEETIHVMQGLYIKWRESIFFQL